MKVFISMPMANRSKEEIYDEFERIREWLQKELNILNVTIDPLW